MNVSYSPSNQPRKPSRFAVYQPGAGGGGSPLAASAASLSDETVVVTAQPTATPAVPQVDGTITVTFSGGDGGPYYVMLVGVDPFPVLQTSPYTITGLNGISDYTVLVFDTAGNNQYLIDSTLLPNHSVDTGITHVYREAYAAAQRKVVTKSLTATSSPVNGTYTSTVNLTQFDDTIWGGVISFDSIDWQDFQSFASIKRVENRDAVARNPTIHGVTGDMSLRDGVGALMGTHLHTVTSSSNLAAFDGIIDYGGTSGVSVAEATSSFTATFNESTNLSRYLGAGTVTLTSEVVTTAVVTGPTVYSQQIAPKMGYTLVADYNFSSARQ